MDEYNIEQLLPDISEERVISVANVLTDSFKDTPLFKDLLFPNKMDGIRDFMLFLTVYYLKTGHVYAMYEKEDMKKQNPLAVSLWNTPEDISICFRGVIKSGTFGKLFTAIVHVGLPAVVRLIQFMSMEDKHRIKGDFVYLFMVASIRKGCGAMLLQDNVNSFEGNDMYLESSVSKNDHAYYKQFGFEMISREIYQGIDNAFFVRRCEKIEK